MQQRTLRLMQSVASLASFPRNLVDTPDWYYLDPKVCRQMAAWPILDGFGPLFYILWGHIKYMKKTKVELPEIVRIVTWDGLVSSRAS